MNQNGERITPETNDENVKKSRITWKVPKKGMRIMILFIIVMIITIIGVIVLFGGPRKEFEFQLGEYKGLSVTVPEVEVTEEDIEQEILNFVQYESDMLPIKDREVVEDGDYVIVDYTGLVDGKEFDYSTAKNFEIHIGSDEFIEGFDAQLIGKKVGETVTVRVTIPDSFPQSDIVGKEAEYTVTIKEIGVREYTDEFVAYNTEYNTTDEYNKYLSQGLEENMKYELQSTVDDQILEQIVKNSTFSSVDQSEIDAKEEEIQETYKTAASYYGLDLESFVASSFGMTMEQYNEEVKYLAELYVKESYVLAEIAKVEGIKITDEEYLKLIEEAALNFGYESAKVLEEKNGGRDKVEKALLENKVLSFLREHSIMN